MLYKMLQNKKKARAPGVFKDFMLTKLWGGGRLNRKDLKKDNIVPLMFNTSSRIDFSTSVQGC